MINADRLYMETTEIRPERTAAEIKAELLRAGANKLVEEYVNGQIVALQFSIEINRNDVPFRLPVRVEPILQILEARSRSKRQRYVGPEGWESRKRRMTEQAARVAWRQIYRWIQAQVALIQTGMVRTEEVFFPYLTMPGTGRTMFELTRERGFKALSAPDGA